MYVTVRKYAGKGEVIDSVVGKVRDEFVPILRRAPGFKGYCIVGSEDRHLLNVSVFDDREGAARANEQAREWVRANLADLLPDPPEIIAGEATLHDVSRLQEGEGGGAEMFAAVRRYDGIQSVEEATRLTREHLMPVITGAPGFRGYYAVLDERDASRAFSVTLFDTRGNAMAAQDKVVPLAREMKVAPNPPAIMTGQVVLAASAEG